MSLNGILTGLKTSGARFINEELLKKIKQQKEADSVDNGTSEFNPNNNFKSLTIVNSNSKAEKFEGKKDVEFNGSMADFINNNHEAELSQDEQYAIAKSILDANRDELMGSVNAYYIVQQALVEDLGISASNDAQAALVELMGGAEISDLQNEYQLSNDDISKLQTIKNKLDNDNYKKFDIDENVERIPFEYIMNASYDDIETLDLPTNSTHNADAELVSYSKDQINVTYTANDKTVEVDISGLDEEAAKKLIQDTIAENYNEVDDYDTPKDLSKGILGSAIMKFISQDEANNDLFSNQGFDEGKTSFNDVLEQLYQQAKDNNGQLTIACPDVDISAIGFKNEKAAKEAISKNANAEITQMHVTQQSVSIADDNIEKGLDILDYVKFGNSDLTMKDALQQTIVKSLAGTPYANKTLSEAMELAKTNKNAEMYQNLKLLQGSSYDTDNPDTFKEAINGDLKDKKFLSVHDMLGYASSALRQELGNNHEVFDNAVINQENQTLYDLLNINVKKLMNEKGLDVIKLEDANYTQTGAKIDRTPKAPAAPQQQQSAPQVPAPEPEVIVEHEVHTKTKKVTVTTDNGETVTTETTTTVTTETTATVTTERVESVTTERVETVTTERVETVTTETGETITQEIHDTVTLEIHDTATLEIHDTVTNEIHDTVTNEITVTCDPVPPVSGDDGDGAETHEKTTEGDGGSIGLPETGNTDTDETDKTDENGDGNAATNEQDTQGDGGSIGFGDAGSSGDASGGNGTSSDSDKDKDKE